MFESVASGSGELKTVSCLKGMTPLELSYKRLLIKHLDESLFYIVYKIKRVNTSLHLRLIRTKVFGVHLKSHGRLCHFY